MATFVFTDAVVTVNAVVLSDHVRQVSLTHEAEALDETAMGATTRTNRAGLLAWNAEIEFYQDFAASEVDVTVNALVGAAAFALLIRSTSGAISATNPEYTGNAIVTSYPILGNSVGELAVSTVSFLSAGALTRDVTP